MSIEYDEYLNKHRYGVRKAFEFIRDNLSHLLVGNFDYEWQICQEHDQSKDRQDEYPAYDAYFYSKNRSYAVVQEFNLAWLKHIHRNPHHWQHWVLIKDNPKNSDKSPVLIEMPYNYIIEMICDWWSFSWTSGDLKSVFKWYDENKPSMMLHMKTSETIDKILGEIWLKINIPDSE